MMPLIPFEINELTKHFTISASLELTSEYELLLTFEFRGPIEKIQWGLLPHSTNRKDELWKHTCLELFGSSAQRDSSPYFEINCALNGDWNAYEFTAYRQGMSPSPTLNACLLGVQKISPAHLQARLQVTSTTTLSDRFYGVCLVLESLSQEKTYWALSHNLEKPDFHAKMAWTASATR